MRSLPEIPNVHATYAVQTRRRMAHAVSELQAILRYHTGDDDIDGVIHQMHEQEEASRRAGFDHISTLCRAMEDGVTEVRGNGRPWRSAAVVTLFDACRAIHAHADLVAHVHADSVAGGVLRLDGGHMHPHRKPRSTT